MQVQIIIKIDAPVEFVWSKISDLLIFKTGL